MVKRSSVVRIGLATALALVLLVVMAQSAFAKISWCDEDLGPMATTAETRIAGTPAYAIQVGDGDPTTPDGHIVSVPVQAVSDAKGGTNTHK